MRKTRVSGAAIAAAVAVMMASGALAAEPSPGASQAQVKCVGGNSCKGQSSCAGASNSCKGQNSCKGKGFVMSSSARECTDKGGKPEQPKSM